MCGRFTQMMSWAEVVRLSEAATSPDLPLFPNFNVSPTHEVPIIRNGADAREAAIVKWGLVPFWADDPKLGYKLINARCETIASKPSFRAAFKKRRCLVPANGFFEWRKPKVTGDVKQPFYITLKGQEPLMFAGLWERNDKNGDPLESCTIVTCAANEFVAQFHNRMPVILPRENYGRWLSSNDSDELQSLLAPIPADWMAAHPVTTRMNSPAFNQPSCIEPLPGG
jgi:putative SOS response-associated peptidase YedK